MIFIHFFLLLNLFHISLPIKLNLLAVLKDGWWGMMIIPDGTIVTKSRRLPDQDGRRASKAGTHGNDLPSKKPHERLLPRV